ncbi:MAG: YcaO-like family protein [Thermoproteota archaeon]|nr:YcaO-like family protein [Thermoproteota archaeon]
MITTRIRSVEDTLDKIVPLCKKIGITRIADITYLDRLYIPNYSVVLPGTEDKIWVYSGKGPTKKQAKASALMETIERYSSLASTNSWKFIRGSYDELSRQYNGRKMILHPSEVLEPLSFECRNDMRMDFMFGFDLLANHRILVPAALALWRYSRPKDKSAEHKGAIVVNPFAHQHTNGLASGNVIEEAICHALCEVIERDAWSLAELQASAIPYSILKKILGMLLENGYRDGLIPYIPTGKFVDDTSIFPDVDISEVEQSCRPIRDLVGRFAKAHIPLIIKDITSDIGIPTFYASSVEWITHDYGYFVDGIGTHPDSRIALIRAITEVSQNRAGNIQGARDDLRKVEFDQNDLDRYRHTWEFTQSKNKIKFSDVKTYVNEDILDDIQVILDHLKESGFKRVIIVDLTNPRVGIPVVRAIVPGLETFQITKSLMGRRAFECFKRSLNRNS